MTDQKGTVTWPTLREPNFVRKGTRNDGDDDDGVCVCVCVSQDALSTQGENILAKCICTRIAKNRK